MTLRTPLASLLAAGMMLLALAATADRADGARPLTTGVSVVQTGFDTGFTTPETGTSFAPLAYQRMREAGAKFTRIIVYWSTVAPDKEPADWDPTNPADPNYDWSIYDQQVRDATAAGLEPLMMIYSAPRWAERCKVDTPGICDPDPVRFGKFSAAAAKRYDGDFEGLPEVRYWEPWNEPNLFLFFEPQYQNGKKVSPLLYRELLNRFAGVVKTVDPANQVVAGGLAPIERPGGLGPLDFARRVLCMTGREKPRPKPGCAARATFDIWANNPYTTGGPTHASAGPDDVSLGDLREMAALLKAARRAGKIRTDLTRVPFWITEFSWDSAPPDPGGLPMGILCRWTSEAMFRAWQAGVSKFFWLSLRDWPRPEGAPYSTTIESGLWFRGPTIEQDRPKRVLKAFRFPFVAFRKEKTISVWGRTPDSSAGRVGLWFKRSGDWRRFATARADRTGVFRLKVKTRLGRGERGRVRAKFGPELSLPFSLKPVKDFRQPPFGRP